MGVGEGRFYKGRDEGHRWYTFLNARHSIWMVSVIPFSKTKHSQYPPPKAENVGSKLRMSFLFSLLHILSFAKDKQCLHSKWTFCLAWKFRGALDFATWNLWRSVLCAKAKSSHLSDGCSGSLRHTNPHVCIAGWLVGVMKCFASATLI